MYLHKKYMRCEPSPNSILCVEMPSSCICVVDPQNGICGVCFLCGWSLVKLLPRTMCVCTWSGCFATVYHLAWFTCIWGMAWSQYIEHGNKAGHIMWGQTLGWQVFTEQHGSGYVNQHGDFSDTVLRMTHKHLMGYWLEGHIHTVALHDKPRSYLPD